MELPVLATEQYPKGLGNTVKELVLEKMKEAQSETKSIILCGIETQACIYHTTLDLLEQGYDVHIPVDCVSSRSMTDRKYALDRLKSSGAFLTTSECMILGLAPDAAHPKFR